MTTHNTSPLAGRVAVVTGASSGIGAATAKRLAASGATVAVLARRADRLELLAEEIAHAGGTALALTVDVTDAQAMRTAAERVAAELGTADLLFNNAGVMLPAPVEELPVEQWQRQIDLNVTGLMNAIGAFLPQLIAAAADKGVADLVNTSSIAAQNLFPNFAVYSGTKAYVTHLSRTLRAELGAKDVRVSAIEPGIVGNGAAEPRHRRWRPRMARGFETGDDLARSARYRRGRQLPGVPACAREPAAGHDHADPAAVVRRMGHPHQPGRRRAPRSRPHRIDNPAGCRRLQDAGVVGKVTDDRAVDPSRREPSARRCVPAVTVGGGQTHVGPSPPGSGGRMRSKHLQLSHRQIPHHRPTRRHRHIIQRPQRRENLTLRTQLRDELLPPRIPQILRVRPTQVPHHPPSPLRSPYWVSA